MVLMIQLQVKVVAMIGMAIHSRAKVEVSSRLHPKCRIAEAILTTVGTTGEVEDVGCCFRNLGQGKVQTDLKIGTPFVIDFDRFASLDILNSTLRKA